MLQHVSVLRSCSLENKTHCTDGLPHVYPADGQSGGFHLGLLGTMLLRALCPSVCVRLRIFLLRIPRSRVAGSSLLLCLTV